MVSDAHRLIGQRPPTPQSPNRRRVLFPVRYSQSFFECAVRGYMCGTLQPLRSLVAVRTDGAAMVGVVIAQVLPTGECGDQELVWPEHAYTEVRSRRCAGCVGWLWHACRTNFPDPTDRPTPPTRR